MKTMGVNPLTYWLTFLRELSKKKKNLKPESEDDWYDGVGESKAVVLNAFVDFPVQTTAMSARLDMQSHAAFSKAKGKGFKGISKRYSW